MKFTLPRNSSSPAELPQAAEVKVYAFNAGVLRTQTQCILKDTRVGTPFDIPVTFMIIKHGTEWLAFDTGCNGKVATDPIGYWGEALVRAFTPVIGPDQEFREAIKLLGLTPRDLKAVICSHGHADHAGAIEDFLGTDVPIYFQRAELAEIADVINTNKLGTPYIRADLEHLSELNIRETDGLFDVFADRSIIAFPTPGHTPGHQSLYVKPSRGQAFICCADALYTLESMEESIPPAIAADVPSAMQNINWFKLEDRTGVNIVPSHDPDFWAKHAWAPSEFVLETRPACSGVSR